MAERKGSEKARMCLRELREREERDDEVEVERGEEEGFC